MNRMILPLRRYFELSGRSSRSEFWLFVLLVILALLVCGTLDSLLGLAAAMTARCYLGRTLMPPKSASVAAYQRRVRACHDHPSLRGGCAAAARQRS